MIFTILTFRALGRTHIASKPCVAIAMLCFDSTVGFPWSVPVLKQQLSAEGDAVAHTPLLPLLRKGNARPDARHPPRINPASEQAPAGDRTLRVAGKGEGGREGRERERRTPSLHPQAPPPSTPPPHSREPSSPAFGSKPSLPFPSHPPRKRGSLEELGPLTGPSIALLRPADLQRRLGTPLHTGEEEKHTPTP